MVSDRHIHDKVAGTRDAMAHTEVDFPGHGPPHAETGDIDIDIDIYV